ncbi:MAG: hypothetical protein V3W41_16090 [Planctomycetota bacterium]
MLARLATVLRWQNRLFENLPMKIMTAVMALLLLPLLGAASFRRNLAGDFEASSPRKLHALKSPGTADGNKPLHSVRSSALATMKPAEQAEEKALVISGRLVDEKGRPIQDTKLSCRFSVDRKFGNPNAGGGGSITTDQEGRFFRLVPKNLYPMARRIRPPTRICFEMRKLSRPSKSASKGVFVDITKRVKTGDLDLGDQTLEAFAILVSGRAQRTNGQPLAAAIIKLRRKDFIGKHERYRTPVGMFDDCLSNKQGQFELRGILLKETSDELFVSASKKGFLDAKKVPCRLSAKTLVVTLEQAGVFRVRLLPTKGISVTSWFYSLRPEAEVGRRRGGNNVSKNGRIEMNDLAPGTYRLQIFGRQLDLLWEKKNITIKGGATADLGDILVVVDLNVYDFEFVDVKGLPIQGVSFQSAGSSKRLVITVSGRNLGPKHQLRSKRSSFDMTFSKKGYLERVVAIKPGLTRVVFRKAERVLIKFPEQWPRLQKGEAIILSDRGFRHILKPGPKGLIQTTGPLPFTPLALGNTTFQLSLQRVTGSATNIQQLSSISFNVNGDAGQVVDLVLPEDLEKRIRKMRAANSKN